ncbi:MAG: type II toxin-antitoxin system PemK/MazF family toxin [Gammaproteobacteria bacterium]|nr:type II toxin-antitoxin system PemK/MazF family toxin [Gammaproteobacteria bacterium]
MKRGDIYLVSLDPIEGHEQNGYRPVLVISASEFNRASGLPVVLPITSGGSFAKKIGFSVELIGTQTTGIIRCDQPRALDLKARCAKKVESIPDDIVDDVLQKLITLFE